MKLLKLELPKAPPSCTSVSGPLPACLLAISRFSASSVALHTACAKRCVNVLMMED